MPGLNPVRALSQALQSCGCRSQHSVDVVDSTTRPTTTDTPVDTQVLRANQQDLDRAAQGRFEAATVGASELEAGLNRWVSQGDMSAGQSTQRQIARQRILEAYQQQRPQLSLNQLALTSLPPEIAQLTHLQHLSLRHNQLTQLPAEIGQLRGLKTLALGQNHLQVLPPELGQLRALESLAIAGNRLASLPREIGQLTHLETLDASGNRLLRLPAEIGTLVNLKRLSLGQNRLLGLPRELGQLRALENLDISANAIAALPREIGQLSALSALASQHNRLRHLPAEMGDLLQLRRLNLSSNQISELPLEIGQLLALRELDLHQNQLAQLPTSLGQLSALRELSLYQNHLAQLPAELGQCSALQRLSLRGNRLTHIDLDALPQNPRLSIDMQNNRFSGAAVQALNQAQNHADYTGPLLMLSIVSSQQTDDLNASHLKAILTAVGHSNAHPLWSALAQRHEMGDTANDFTLLLAKIHNEAPRENNRLTGRITGHITRVLTTLEQLYNQAQNDPSKNTAIEDLLSNAHDSVSECVDRAAIHLLLMSAKSLHYQSGNPQAMADYHTIHRTIDFVARLNKNDERKLVFDNDSERFRPFTEITGNNYHIFRVGDEVEDILQLLNSGLLKSIEGCDMRFGNFATLTEARHLETAKQFITAS